MKAKDFQGKDVEGLKSWFEANVGDDFRPTLAIFLLDLPRECFYLRLEHLEGGDEEALGILHEHGKTDVVLVLSDINMPGMTGLELMERITAEPPPLPVCMMTAYDNDEYRERAHALGCAGYVSKPVDFTALKTRIKELVG